MPKYEPKPWQKIKGVRFNTRNPAEKRLFEYVESIDSFSAFVKHLITNHLAAGWERGSIEVKSRKEVKTQSSSKGLPIDF
jgi:hypothetical protein